MYAEAGPSQREAGDHQLGVEVRVPAVVVQWHERVEQVDAAREEHGHEHRRVRGGRGLGGGGLEQPLGRHRVGAIEREARAEPGAEDLPAREGGASQPPARRPGGPGA